MNTKKEVAKFFAGATAWEAIGHLVLAFTDVLPLNVWGFTLTPAFNGVWVVIVAAVSILLARYAWGPSGVRQPTSRIPGGSPMVP